MEKDEYFAFPNQMVNCEGIKIGGQKGMTLRDYFAAKAMQVLLQETLNDTKTEFPCAVDEWVSKNAYETADAMLKVRDET